jgi:hypothetical protein
LNFTPYLKRKNTGLCEHRTVPSFKMLKQVAHFHETWHDTIPLEATRAPFFKFVTCKDNIAAYERTRDAGDTITLGKSRVVPGQAMKALGGVNV